MDRGASAIAPERRIGEVAVQGHHGTICGERMSGIVARPAIEEPSNHRQREYSEALSLAPVLNVEQCQSTSEAHPAAGNRRSDFFSSLIVGCSLPRIAEVLNRQKQQVDQADRRPAEEQHVEPARALLKRGGRSLLAPPRRAPAAACAQPLWLLASRRCATPIALLQRTAPVDRDARRRPSAFPARAWRHP